MRFSENFHFLIKWSIYSAQKAQEAQGAKEAERAQEAQGAQEAQRSQEAQGSQAVQEIQ